MTDYNDGKVHGWNDGERPVHPKSLQIDSIYNVDTVRVTNVHREGKVIWVNEYAKVDVSRRSREEAMPYATQDAIRVAVKYQEVIEND